MVIAPQEGRETRVDWRGATVRREIPRVTILLNNIIWRDGEVDCLELGSASVPRCRYGALIPR